MKLHYHGLKLLKLDLASPPDESFHSFHTSTLLLGMVTSSLSFSTFNTTDLPTDTFLKSLPLGDWLPTAHTIKVKTPPPQIQLGPTHLITYRVQDKCLTLHSRSAT